MSFSGGSKAENALSIEFVVALSAFSAAFLSMTDTFRASTLEGKVEDTGVVLENYLATLRLDLDTDLNNSFAQINNNISSLQVARGKEKNNPDERHGLSSTNSSALRH